MSTVEPPASVHRPDPEPGSPEDPFRLGWRYVRETRPDGTVVTRTVPLTPRDLLFPQEEDQAMHVWTHGEDCRRLCCVLQLKMTGLADARVHEDHRVDFNLPGVEPLGPDVVLFRDVPLTYPKPPTFTLADSGARPVLVVEVTSDDTRGNDFGIKMDFYHRARVEVYVIVDARHVTDEVRRVRLLGFRHTVGGYEMIPLDDQGRLWVEPAGLWFRVEDGLLAFDDGATGRPIEPFVAQALARQAAEERAANAAARAEAATARADAEARIAEAATIQAKASEAGRLAAETWAAAMEAELRRLCGEA